MTQDELKNALLDALLEYETLRKTRRLRALKKALRGSVMATVIGSAGLSAANGDRSIPVRETVTAMASSQVPALEKSKPAQEMSQETFIKGAAHFDLNQYRLTPEYEAWLLELTKQFPKGAELSVIGRSDALGVPLYNKKLGKLRAVAVANFLVDHGIKIKSISSKISIDTHYPWMERRVDLIVNPTLSIANNDLSPLDIQQLQKQSENQAEPQKALSAMDYHHVLLQALRENENKPHIRNQKNSELNSANAVAKAKPDQLKKDRQKVSGVTHFALNRHTLTSTHKERLMELIKLLPDDAELTVIGRTDAFGGDDYNKTLGLHRAKTVAIFLANHGVKVKAVASKVSSDRFKGWMARRVDIIVDSALAQLSINLPPPVIPAHIQGREVATESKAQPVSSIKSKKPSAIERDVTRLIQHARYRFNVNETGEAFTDTAQRWYNSESAFRAR